MGPKRSIEKKPASKPTKKAKKDTGGSGSKGELVEVKCGPSFTLTAPPPTRNALGQLVFEGAPEFRPNLTPQEVLQMGSFGGTYFRPIKSSVTGESYRDVCKELPSDWLKGLNIKTQIASSIYDTEVNKFKVKCGGSLEMWEQSGWIHKQDPYGWFMWYCRYFQGRRTEDDERQIGRWSRCAGPKGRWRQNLVTKNWQHG
ncbi:uncharacterized protein LOC135094451 isoform X2 [Scylla paramamosain]|uniref:uncharacterized protein LOC135094451 isoform X2 n=1 Tax=Scylla paramamosain TaxID=85552 RepID=UPI003083EC6F